MIFNFSTIFFTDFFAVNFLFTYICTPKMKGWPVRLGVRTQDFHSWNRGSIPLRATKNLPGNRVNI